MFKFDLEIPTYAEWKVQLDKLMNEQPEQAKKYQEQVQKFWQDFFEDTLKIKGMQLGFYLIKDISLNFQKNGEDGMIQ